MVNVNENDLLEYFKQHHPDAVGFRGMGYRAVSKKYADLNRIVQASGSFIGGGRYNFEAKFGVLYLSCDPKTCIDEALRSIDYSPTKMVTHLPKMMVGLKVELSKVLRLSKEHILAPTKLNKEDLVDSDWQGKQQSGKAQIITQIVGKAAKMAGYEAVLVPSARRDGCNLNIFLDNLGPTSKIRLFNVNDLCSTDLGYEEACDESLKEVANRVSRELTDMERNTLFCPKDNIVC